MIKQKINKIVHMTSFPAIILFIVSTVFFLCITPVSKAFVYTFINTNVALMCLVIGESVIMLTGGIDISIGALVSLCNVVLVQLMERGTSPLVTVLVVLVLAIVAGALNGFVVSYLRVTPLLTTFATSAIYAGLALLVAKSPVYMTAKVFQHFYKLRPLGIPMSLLFVVIPFVIWKIYKATPRGMFTYALGANEYKAFLSGINVPSLKFTVYCFGGLTAGIGAIAMTSLMGGADPLVGTSLSMTAVSASVIGGISLAGGKGDITGGVFGVLFYSMLTNILITLNVNAYWQQLLQALILLFSVLATVLLSFRKDRKGGK